MILFPNAKINLGLNVLRKRDDNYHDISSVMYPVGLCDILEIMPSGQGESQIHFSGLPVPGNKDDNLVLKAYRVMLELKDIPPVNIYLHKQIPMGAGMGGGSSDAAFALKGLNELFTLKLSTEELEYLAGKIGSDCPFFIRNIPVAASGKGTVLKDLKIDLSGYFIFLVYPHLHISTADAYSGISPAAISRAPDNIILNEKPENWKFHLTNDFEKPAFEKFPILKRIKEMLYDQGAVYASMTGSGSAMYGLFSNRKNYINEHFEKLNADTQWIKGSLPGSGI